MKLPLRTPAFLSTIAFCTSSALGGTLVNDTWLDGDRTVPASPAYSEFGIDTDLDGDLESAWFKGGGGTLTVVGAGGPLRGTVATASSSSWTTYFAPEATPVSLLNVGDQLRITWIFTPTTLDTTNSGQSLRLAIADTPEANRVSTEASPGDATYAGYGLFMNMSTTLSNGTPFQLRERAAPGTASAFLSASASWSGLASDGAVGQAGYTSSTEYAFVFNATRNAADGLDIATSMSGGNLGNDGLLEVSYTDATPNSFVFNTFGVRPSRADQSAAQFDTRLFKVEFVPEPVTGIMLGLGALMLIAASRNAHR